jgi:hypothetical protein
LADKYLEQAAQQLLQLCSSSSSSSAAAATPAAADTAAAAAKGDADPLVFKTHCRALLATMAASVIGLMSRLRDFDGFTDGSSSSSSSSGDGSWGQLKVVGTTGANMIGAPGVRDRAAAALTAAVKHLQGGDRELLEQVRHRTPLLCAASLSLALLVFYCLWGSASDPVGASGWTCKHSGSFAVCCFALYKIWCDAVCFWQPASMLQGLPQGYMMCYE